MRYSLLGFSSLVQCHLTTYLFFFTQFYYSRPEERRYQSDEVLAIDFSVVLTLIC